jgi:hypothetical protein
MGDAARRVRFISEHGRDLAEYSVVRGVAGS